MITRRDFIKNVTLFSVAAPSVMASPFALAAGNRTQSKALVCVMLDGGNDSANMVIPTSTSHYQTYYDLRPDLAQPKEKVLPIPAAGVCRDGQSVTLGLHPAMTALADLCNAGEASVIVNCGVLRQPVTKEQADTQGYLLPPFLFSHNSQKTEVCKGAVGYNWTTGWAGRLMDVLSSGQSIAPLFSHAGDIQLLRAQTYNQNIIKGDNISKLNANAMTVEALAQMQTLPSEDGFAQTVQSTGHDAINVAARLIDTIDAIPDEDDLPLYPNTGLGKQFRVTSRLIRQRVELGHSHQIFFLRLSGFDTHVDQENTHKEKYAELSDAMAAFNAHLKTLGLHEDVITITLSDFGRRIPANGTGTDHGWGGHQLIMGGPVDASSYIGTWPDYTVEGPDTVERGRLLPSIATDQIHISLGRWLGATETTLKTVFPNYDKFERLDVVKQTS
ncbi:DUF1501 domain-containing protein [Photobacterium aphoticum]|nr:DUF1501 domain-containing protein [Photobacterium aphoticum]PSU58716.1 DUF1501 domain-containing protein [Photobacterium aphoticum]GHA32549.1 Tat pathway signal protein [Photobacterium aphoticum]